MAALAATPATPALGDPGFATIDLLETDGAPAAFAYDISESGEVVGTLRGGEIASAFRWSRSAGLATLERTDFFAPAGAAAIDGGAVVGSGAVNAQDLLGSVLRWPAGSLLPEVLGQPDELQGAIARGAAQNASIIVGVTIGPGGVRREQAFVWRSGAFGPLADAPSGAEHAAGGLAGGWILGGSGLVQGAVWTTQTDLPAPGLVSGAAWSHVTAVNVAGDAVGAAGSATGPRAYIARAPALTAQFLHAEGVAERSVAHDLNDVGEVVGTLQRAEGPAAFVWSAGSGLVELQTLLTPADAASWQLLEARGVNNAGQIAGFGLYDDPAEPAPVVRAFRLTLPGRGECPADLTGDGAADAADVTRLLADVAAGGPASDYDASGSADFLDVLCYLRVFDDGCP